MQVKIQDIIDGIEMQSEENRSYLNLKSGEVIGVSREALILADDGEEYDHLPEWQQEEVKIAYEIVETSNYASLPSHFDLHDYEIMEAFCLTVSDDKQRDLLLRSIRGKGAFRRFKENVERMGIIDKWYEYRDQRYEQIAIEFCESRGIDYR